MLRLLVAQRRGAVNQREWTQKIRRHLEVHGGCKEQQRALVDVVQRHALCGLKRAVRRSGGGLVAGFTPAVPSLCPDQDDACGEHPRHTSGDQRH
jgi:hypothetical protein